MCQEIRSGVTKLKVLLNNFSKEGDKFVSYMEAMTITILGLLEI